jgi:hypothetical protein
METRPAGHRARRSFSVEKWYLDAFLDDGSFLLVVVGRLRALGTSWARLNVEWHPLEGQSIRLGVPLHEIAGPLTDAQQVRWDLPASAGELSLVSGPAPIVLRDPLLRDGRRVLRWSMLTPDSEVTGWLRVGDRRMPCRGRAYRDYLMVDLTPWRMRRWRLQWGRAVSASHSQIWFRLETPSESLAGRWEDGVASARPEPPHLLGMRVLADEPVIELPIFQFGALGRALARLAGEPRQRRVLATTTIAGEPARAVHEDVQWG